MPLRRMIYKEGRKWEDYPLVSVANMEIITLEVTRYAETR